MRPPRIRPRPSRIAAAGAGLLLVVLSACGDASESIERELQNATRIHHLGCTEEFRCGQDRRVCDLPALVADLEAGKTVAVEYESTESQYTARSRTYWFGSASGGTKYFYLQDDVSTSTCGSTHCGWHRASYTTLRVTPSAGGTHVTIDDGRQDFGGARDWPNDPDYRKGDGAGVACVLVR
jgi:hypothetical protein